MNENVAGIGDTLMQERKKGPVCRLELLGANAEPKKREGIIGTYKRRYGSWGCQCMRKQEILTLAVKLGQYEYAFEARGKAKFCFGPRHGGSAGSDATWNIGETLSCGNQPLTQSVAK